MAHAAAPAPELLSFGDASSGELGRRPDEGGDLSSAPTVVDLPGQVGEVAQVAAGAGHTLVVTSNGQLYAFGDNYFGELGSTSDFRQKLPNPAAAVVGLPGASGPVVEASAGGGFSLARTASGQLYAFGDDRLGELGAAFPVGQDGRANPTPSIVPGIGPVVRVSAGPNFALALTTSGAVYSWGGDATGQLGQSRNEGKEEAADPTPLPVPIPGGVTQIAAGGFFALAVTATGQLYGWGADPSERTGETEERKTRSPKGSAAVPHQIVLPGQNGPITQVAAGGQFAVVLTSTGQVFTFGDDGSGQLGRPKKVAGHREEPQATPAPVSLPAGAGTATRIAAGSEEAFVQTSGGQIYGFGSNLYGELGVLTNFDDGGSYETPTLLAFPGFSAPSLVGGGSATGASFIAAVPQAPAGAPALTGLQVTRSAFELNRGGRRCYTPWGAIHKCSRTTPLHIGFSLDRSATVTFTLERRTSSRLRHGVCQQEGATRQDRCSYMTLVGSWPRSGTAQGNAFVFHGLLGGHILTPGEYRLTAFPQAGGLTGSPQRASFTVAP